MKKYHVMQIVIVLLFFSSLFLNCSKEKGEVVYSTLQFEIVDKDSGEPLPAKLIFLNSKGKEATLNLPKTKGICAEKNGFYTVSGKGSVEIPIGKYKVYASRGMEYSIDKRNVKIKPNKVTKAKWKLHRELDTDGFVFCDMHFHTTNSDGTPTPEERMITLVGEGLEYAAVTDHNFITDLPAAAESLKITPWIKVSPGDEYTTSVGHYNVYPLSPDFKPFEHNMTDARIQFGLVRAIPGPVVLQVNHPRSNGLDYFGHFNLNPITGDTDHPQFSWDFDALEIMNSLPGHGLFTSSENKLSTWEDWVNFLNKDFRPTGVANSDAHGAIRSPVGMPGSYVMSDAKTPSEIDPNQIAKNVNAHKVTMARGVFVNLIANKKYSIGSEFIPKRGKVELLLQVQAPSWAKVETATLYGNGRVVWTGKIKKTRGAQKYKKKIKLSPEVDTWYVARAEGSQSLWPIIPRHSELDPVTPVGLTNPIWVDIDGNGFECERERVRKVMAGLKDDLEKFRKFARKADWITQKQLYALTPKGSKNEKELIKIFAFSDDKVARELAYERLAEIKDEECIDVLKKVRTSAPTKYEKMLAKTYLATLGDCKDWLDFAKKVVKTKDAELKAAQIKILSLNRFLRDWHIIGPFPNEDDKGLATVYGPEKGIDLNKTEMGKNGAQVEWQSARAEPSGYVNFMRYYDQFDHSVAYAYAVLNVPEEMETVLLFGSDDGAAVWQNGQQIYYRFIRRGAAPGQEIIPVKLKKGENHFLVKVENGGGGSGFYFELLDPCHKLDKIN